MKSYMAFGALVLALALTSGCDGRSASMPVAPPNSAPRFTSAASASIFENAQGVAYQAVATDPENDPIQFSILGGADSALFSMSANGQVSFRAAPDFENPQDANRDNVYELDVQASDGRLTAVLPVRISVKDKAFTLRQLPRTFEGPIRLVPIPDGSGLYVVERRGLVWRYDPINNRVASEPFLDVSGDVATGNDAGLINIEVTQEKYLSGTLAGTPAEVTVFVYLINRTGQIEVRRTLTEAFRSVERVAPGPMEVMFKIDHQGPGNYGGGLMRAGPDSLFIGVGDNGGSVAASEAQNPQSLLGKILHVSRRQYPYGIPPGVLWPPNSGLPEVYAMGLRDPAFIVSFGDERAIITDTYASAQEINLLAAANFGWPAFEGRQTGTGNLYNGGVASYSQHRPPAGIVAGSSPGLPFIAGRFSQVVINGQNLIDDLSTSYFFGDSSTGRIWTVDKPAIDNLAFGNELVPSDIRERTTEFTPAASLVGLTSFVHSSFFYVSDRFGRIYVVESVSR